MSNESGAYKTLTKDYFCKGIIERRRYSNNTYCNARGRLILLTAENIPKRIQTLYSIVTRSYKYDNSLYDDAHNSDLRAVASELNLEVIEVGAWCDNYLQFIDSQMRKRHDLKMF